MILPSFQKVYFLELFDGLREGVFPGVVLLSLRLWSGLPVDFAIGFGPGFNPIIFYILYKI
jgi:hypothetical protein